MPKQLHSLQYPTLSRIARDYLPIQGSAVPSERAFSSGGITSSTLRRNLLAPSTFGALQLLKAAYKNAHISAVSEAQSYAYPERVPRVSGCLNFAPCNFYPQFHANFWSGSAFNNFSEPDHGSVLGSCSTAFEPDRGNTGRVVDGHKKFEEGKLELAEKMYTQ